MSLLRRLYKIMNCMAKPNLVIVMVTCPPDSSAKIARMLIDEKLAACVNVIPAKSFYNWEGKYCQEQEDLLIIKGTKESYANLERRIKAIHPYSIPEIVALDMAAVSQQYASWVVDQTTLSANHKPEKL